MEMTTFEEWQTWQIQKYARLAKEESSGPYILKSNKLLYELGKEKLEAQLDSWKRGKPSAQSSGEWLRILRAMDIEPAHLTFVLDSAGEKYDEYKPIIERLGFPEKCCERTTTQLAVCELGVMRKPTIILGDGHGCDADHKYTSLSLAAWFNLPVFYVDVPLNEDDKPNLASINYIADQLGEFIEWVEKEVPGVKYDEDKLIEWQEKDAIGEKYSREIYQLIRHVPCPMSPKDGIRHRAFEVEPSRFPDGDKANEYLRVLRDELGERVSSGRNLYPERLRLLWAGASHDIESVDVSRVVLERQIAVPLVVHGGVPKRVGLRCQPIFEMSEYGVKLSPLQEEARRLDTSSWGGSGKRWINGTLLAAGDIGAHGIIHFNLIGCTPMRGMSSVVAERAEKELGIPTLSLEARQMEKGYMRQEQFDEIMSSFIDKCFDWAGKPRQ